jgi:uncharacterized membrane protein YeiH
MPEFREKNRVRGLNRTPARDIGVGLGMFRNLPVAEIPTVLHADLYAVAPMAGAAVVVGGGLLQLSPTAATFVGAAVCFGLRVMASLVPRILRDRVVRLLICRLE